MIIGVTYKKDVKDLRKSPAIDIIELLIEKKVHVGYFDPLIPYLKLNHIHLKSVKLSKSLLKGMDCVVIAADHKRINYNYLLKNSKLIFDAKGVFKNKKSERIIKL